MAAPPQDTAEYHLGRLQGKVALVTGGANEGGFGAAISKRFLAEGAKVLIGDLDGDGAKNMAERLSTPNVRGIHMDVTSLKSWETAVELIVKEFGRLDIIVNNAGTTYPNKPTAEVGEDEFDRVFAVNVKSIFLSVKVGIPQMQKQGHGGAVINISSTGAIRPRPGLVWYNSSKGAVSNATKGLAAEYGKDQIRVTAICPLMSATQLFTSFSGVENTPENQKKFAEGIPLQRLTQPTDVANAAVFLASDEGKFITGVNFEVDGGRCI